MIFDNFDIKHIYNDLEDINLETYLNKCGVEDFDLFIRHISIENDNNYENLSSLKDKFLTYYKTKTARKTKPLYILLDSDLDGYMSGSIVYLFMKDFMSDIKLIPIHHSEDNPKAHGLEDDEVMEYLRNAKKGLLWIPDAGSSNVKECKELNELGYTIFVTDHHKQTKIKEIDGVEYNIDDYAIVVNNQNGNVENRCGSGALVTWHCLNGIDNNYSSKLVPYVMISLISDSMNMNTAENYTFSFWGKQKINECNSLKQLVDKFNYKSGQFNKDYSFGLISKCNATIRLGSIEDKENLFRLLVNEKSEEEIKIIMDKMSTLHSRQLEETKRLVGEIENTLDFNKKYILKKIDEKTALTGLVANKLLSKYGKTVFLLHERENGEVAGSVRSNFGGLNDRLNESGLFNYNEGHDTVFGTSYNIDKEKEVIDYLDAFFTHYKPYIEVLNSYRLNSIPEELFKLREHLDAFNICGKEIETPKIHIYPFEVNGNDYKKLIPSGTMLRLEKGEHIFIFQFISSELQKYLKVGENINYKIELIGEPQVTQYGNQILVTDFEVKENNNNWEDIF